MDSDPEPSPNEPRVSARVGVVDDDPLSSSMQAHLVSLLGHQALVETDPQRAIERALDGQFDLLLLDLGMPGLDGFEALRQLRQREAAGGRPQVPVIAVTGYTSEADRLRCLMAGFTDHISKPIHAEAFESALRRVLDQRGAETAAAASQGQSDADRLRATARRLSDPKTPNRSFGPTVMERFALRAHQLIEAMRMGLAEQDAEQVVRSARAMKSLAELLGVNRLADMCAQLEQAAVAQHWSAAAAALEEIEHGNQAMLTVLFESAR